MDKKLEALDEIILEARLLLNLGSVTWYLLILLVLGSIFAGAAISPVLIPLTMAGLALVVKMRRIQEAVRLNNLDISIQGGLGSFILKLGSSHEEYSFKKLNDLKGGRSNIDSILRQIDRILMDQNHSVVSRITKKTVEHDFVLNSANAVYSLFVVVNLDSGRVAVDSSARSVSTGITENNKLEFEASAETFKLLVLMHNQLKNKEKTLDLRLSA